MPYSFCLVLLDVKTVTGRSSRISVTNCRPSSTVPTTSTPSTRNEGVGGLLTSVSRAPASTSSRSATSIADPLVSASPTPRRCVPSPNPSLADRYRPRFPQGSVTVPPHSLDLESSSEYTLSTPRSAPARGHSGVPNDSGVSSGPWCFIRPLVLHFECALRTCPPETRRYGLTSREGLSPPSLVYDVCLTQS